MQQQLSSFALRIRLSRWLFLCAGMIVVMIILGGATRLTGSGLSIVEWRPLSGVLPPVSLEGWQELFHAYQRSPEYQQINMGMSLEDFKDIFWLEFIHRLWGRLIGVVFLVPLIISYGSVEFRSTLFPRLMCIWLLGGLQGVVGWYMVKSGLSADPHVSHYRLALHLFLGFTTYGLTVYYALNIRTPLRERTCTPGFSRMLYGILVILFGLTVFYGALVAGLKAGLMYNTFPTMNGAWVPHEWMALHPWWKNFIDNHATVQWIHRCLAVSSVITATLFGWYSRLQRGSLVIMGAFYIQAGIGIVTLVWQVPLSLGILHQAGALLVLSTLIFWWVRITRPLEQTCSLDINKHPS